MVNATQMAKTFGKRPVDWLQNQQSQDYIDALSEVRNITSADLVRVIKGGNPSAQGTWMHEDVALEFARWLNPAFAIWCNDRIKELLTTGVATITNDDEAILHAMNVLQKRVNEQKQQVAMLEQEVEQLAPKAEYTDKVLQSSTTYTFTEVAKEIGMRSGKALYEALHKAGYIYKVGKRWVPYANRVDQNYFATRTYQMGRPDGFIITRTALVFTERGRHAMNCKYNQKNKLSL